MPVSVLWFFRTMPWVGLLCVIVVHFVHLIILNYFFAVDPYIITRPKNITSSISKCHSLINSKTSCVINIVFDAITRFNAYPRNLSFCNSDQDAGQKRCKQETASSTWSSTITKRTCRGKYR